MKIKDRFTDYLVDGTLFQNLHSYFEWMSEADASQLSLMFMARYSQREESPLMEQIADNAPDRAAINSGSADVIRLLYRDKWDRFWQVQTSEYNPINNYDMVEEETVDRSHTDEDSTTDQLTRTGTETTDEANTSERGVYGFNGATPSPSETDESSGQTQLTLNTTDSRTGTRTNEGGENVDRRLTRSGNIGVTTTQQMLQQELELWKWNFYESILADVAGQLTTPLY